MGALMQTGRAFSVRQLAAIPKRRWAPEGSQVAFDFRTGDYLGTVPIFVRDTPGTIFDDAGRLLPVAAGKMRQTSILGVLLEGTRTNRLALKNANPTDTTGWLRTGNASAALSVVNDSAALAAAKLGEVCTSGNVLKLVNTAGSGNAAARGTVVAGVMSHASFGYVRGTGQVRIGVSGATAPFVALTEEYKPLLHIVPTPTTTAVYILEVTFGSSLNFILPQLEVGNTVSSSIINDGSATTRDGEQLGADLSDFDDLSDGFGGVFEYDLRQLAASGGSPVLFSIAGTTGNRVQFALSGSDLVGQVYSGGSLIKSQKVSSWATTVGAVAFGVSSNHLWARRIGQADEGVATGFTLPSLSTLGLLGNVGTTDNNCHGYARRIAMAFGTQGATERAYWYNVGAEWRS